jgi:hypothetical protein
MRNSPYGITVPFRANATINKFRILSVWSPDERAYLKALFATEDVA